MLRFFIIFKVSLLLSNHLFANCTFKTGDFLEEINNPAFIKSIDVEVPKSAKFNRNFAKILVSKSKNIPQKLKKNFSSIVTVVYEFGSCSFKAKVKQTGDWKDHISLADSGQPLRSLNVRLEEGNVLNAVRFKLLIPETRGNLNEVFATVLMRKLGFIAPETFAVKTSINGSSSIMLFQEDARKELLERNYRREGPILEGDESLLWGEGNFFEGRNVHLDNISLSRLINDNWLLKGPESAKISLRAASILQSSYLTWADNSELFGRFMQPNDNLQNIFQDFHFLSLALNAKHGLAMHNRRFYFNSFLDAIEPIYYDGNVEFFSIENHKESIVNQNTFRLSFNKNYSFPLINRLNEDLFQSELFDDFKIRTKLNTNSSFSLFSENFKIFIRNVELLQQYIVEFSNYIHYEDYLSADPQSYLSRVKKLDLTQSHVKEINFQNENISLITFQNKIINGSLADLGALLSDFSLEGSRAIYLGLNQNFSEILLNKTWLGGTIKYSSGILIDINKSSKVISFIQSKPSDWVLISNVNLNGWKIFFSGVNIENKISTQSQRFNEFGLTGCLNFYKTQFNDVMIETNNGMCEDSVNIVNSDGNINTLKVLNGFADGIDIDFSRLKINLIEVRNSSNDCFDVSSGVYEIVDFEAVNCGDKGISVGEKSILSAKYISVDTALLGASSKDQSSLIIDSGEFTNVSNCFESAQKKQEFGGAIIKLKKVDCEVDNIVDQNSSIVKNNYEL